MAKTIAFTSTDDDFSVSINGVAQGTWVRYAERSSMHEIDYEVHLIVVTLKEESYLSFIIDSADTVTFDAVEFEGTMRELYAEIKDTVYASAGATEVVVYKRKTVLTDAQIKAAVLAPIELVPAQGAGKGIVFHTAWFHSKVTVSYETGSNADAEIVYGPAGGYTAAYLQTSISALTAGLTKILVVPQIGVVSGGYVTEILSAADVEAVDNVGLYFAPWNDEEANFTGGDAGNTLEITVFYSLIDL
jgi:hypothetical protein